MSLNRTEIAHLIVELQCLQGAQILDCIQKEARQLFLVFKTTKGSILTLLLGFQEPFLRFHLTSQKQRVTHGELSRKLYFFLQDSYVMKIEQLNDDRILQVTFQKEKQLYRLVGEFFSKRPNLFLLDSQNHILASLNSVSAGVYIVPSLRPPDSSAPNAPILSSQEIESRYLVLEKAAVFQKEKQSLHREIRDKIKKCEKYRLKHTQELQQLEKWKDFQEEGELIQANLFRIKKGMASLEVEDWFHAGQLRVLTFDIHEEPAERIAQLFRQAKKRKGGIERCQAQLIQASIDLEQWESALVLAEKAVMEVDLQNIRNKWLLHRPAEKQKETIALPFFEYQSEVGLKIWVGKGAKQNERLTFSYAKGSDWWLHVRDFPGAHVVIRVAKGQRPDRESLKDAFQLALAYSKAKNQGKAEILLTQCKHVSRFGRKKIGQVHVSSHEIFLESFDSERFQKIKNRKIK
ncbi:NFACT RNA binding domain-containing protein [Parachlamydia acanthamoebae]|uniref:NFACT RNA binding domain-containing protein n=1 Tax=Parachlamydia acanthamoebae TaxID=83552 RepID=UPI0007512D59|nr:NFACT RNA binding domain-containing protein [Parachlamydia acanthamoebae]